MIRPNEPSAGRLLIISDVDRLGPILRQHFQSCEISAVRDYLSGIAEIPRITTRAVVVGHDPSCRDPGAAVWGIKVAAGESVPVVFCCEPAFENVGKRVLQFGADDYVIFPPEAADLQRALGLSPPTLDARSPDAGPMVLPPASAEELGQLAEVLRLVMSGDASCVDAMARLIHAALQVDWAEVTLSGRIGRSGNPSGHENPDPASRVSLVRGGERVGEVRVGPGAPGQADGDPGGRLYHYSTLFGRMLEAARRAHRWRRLALTDDLTGLPNRRHLLGFLEEKLEGARKHGASVTVLIFDIDDFKRYNDRYGHEAGDDILREVGRLFRQCCRKDDMVARYGGDEYVVVFWDAEAPRIEGSHHPQGVIDVLQRFRKALRSHTFSRLGPEAQGFLTLSGGLAHFPSAQASSAAALIEAADHALLQAKAAGKNRFLVVGEGDAGSAPTPV